MNSTENPMATIATIIQDQNFRLIVLEDINFDCNGFGR